MHTCDVGVTLSPICLLGAQRQYLTLSVCHSVRLSLFLAFDSLLPCSIDSSQPKTNLQQQLGRKSCTYPLRDTRFKL